SNGKEAPGFPVDLGGALPDPADAVNTDIFSSPMPFTPTAGPNKGRRMLYVGAASHQDSPCIHGALFALDALSGRIVWRFDTVPPGRGPGAGQLVWKTTTSVASAAGGFEGSTGFAAGAVVGTTFSGPGFETALDAFTGSLKWDAPDAASSLSPVGIVNGLVFA